MERRKGETNAIHNEAVECGNGDLQGPARDRQELHVSHSAIQEPELRKPALEVAIQDYHLPLGPVIQQTLKQIDHEL
jgi:hypothetical protein